jgi:agmatine deiminase
VDADTNPPLDPELMSRWLGRWVPRLPGPAAGWPPGPQDLAEHHPACFTLPAAGPPSAPPAGLRLPAQWEPVAHVLLVWPVLYPVLWEFAARLVGAVRTAAGVRVVVPAQTFAAAVELALLRVGNQGPGPVDFVVGEVDDVWVRDFGPLGVLDADDRLHLLDAVYDPPPRMPQAADDAFPGRYASALGCGWSPLPLHLEGGNLWADGAGTVLTTARLRRRNRSVPVPEVQALLFDMLGVHRVIELPALRGEVTGHVDLVCKLTGTDTALVGEPGAGINAAPRREAASRLRRHGYRVLTLPSPPGYLNRGVVPVWPSYTNALTVNGTVVVPVFGDPNADGRALATFTQAMPDHRVLPVDARVVTNAGGTVHCLTMQLPAHRPPVPA